MMRPHLDELQEIVRLVSLFIRDHMRQPELFPYLRHEVEDLLATISAELGQAYGPHVGGTNRESTEQAPNFYRGK